ncbi:LTA synthase family protein [Paenalcaligenes hominis]|uniref:LTA synthase family protein n=1 Tax=Paenalcaligenes hominis TaxID=643674 RepID=UPI0035264B87
MSIDFALIALVVLGYAVSLLLDYAAKPRPRLRRHLRHFCVHAGLWSMGFAFEMLLFQRPWFALFNLIGLQLLLIIISNMKQHFLREPFFYTDTEYFWDAIKHPRLYLPFFGIANTVLGFAVYIAAAALAFYFEPAYHRWLAAVLWFAGTGAVALFLGGALARAQPSWQPSADIQQMGFTPALWRYAQAERQALNLQPHAPFAQSWQAPAVLPHLVLLQSESFFDPRRYYADYVQPQVLAQFDQMAAAGQSGVLQVPSWGANTVRTEYAVLSGLEPALLGVHQFNPYRRLAKHCVPSLAQYLRSMGYKTICVHPYAASFYRRNTAMPLLGFDEFIDIHAFGKEDYFGAYVSDAALGRKVTELVQAHIDQPVFVHVITMENHGPLHWETVSHTEAKTLLQQPVPKGAEDLLPYVRHIQHADQLLQQLQQTLAASSRPAGLCMFGDHVPIMSGVYQQLGEPDGTTDYLLWRSDDAIAQPHASVDDSLTAAQLGSAFLSFMGFKAKAAQIQSKR